MTSFEKVLYPTMLALCAIAAVMFATADCISRSAAVLWPLITAMWVGLHWWTERKR